MSEGDLKIGSRVISAETMGVIQEALKNLAILPKYQYPWEKLDEEFDSGQLKYLRIIGFGSLMNTESATRTLIGAQDRTPVIAFGAKRIYNYAMSKVAADTRFNMIESENSYAALNARVTGNPRDAFNGIMLPLIPEDIGAFRAREVSYNLKPVVCLDWFDLSKPAVPAYVLECPEGNKTTHGMRPHSYYEDLCSEGAAEISEDFMTFYHETTVLDDEETLLSEWHEEQEARLGK